LSSSKDELVRKMARLMQSGAVMLEQTCPICGAPLFRLPNGDIVCPIHGRVRIVGSEEEASLAEAESVLRELVAYSAGSIKKLISSGSGPEDIGRWIYVMEKALDVEMKIRNLSNPASQSGQARRKPQGKADR
jgi:UPF0148 protein